MIDAVAQQWIWRFFYPGGPGQTSKPGEIPPYSETGGRPGDRTYSVNELVVPVDTPVVLNITSTDVMHRWFVPALGGQVDAVPGNTSRTWFKADRIGLYPGQSTMFSGTGYSAMRTWVRVVSVPDYQSYLEKQTHELGAAQAYVHPRVLTLAGGNLPGSMRLVFLVSLLGIALLYVTLWKYEMAAKSARMQVRALRRTLLGEEAVAPLKRSAAPS